MKKFIIIFIIAAVVAAMFIPLLTKHHEINVSKDGTLSIETKFNRPSKQLVVEDTAFVDILDIKGADVNLFSFNSSCIENPEGLNYKGSLLDNIFAHLKVFPIAKPSGLVALFYIDGIDEYFYDGKNSSILFKDGNLIKGFPVNDYTISGRSSFGDISLTMENINFVKFNKNIPVDNNYKPKEQIKNYVDLSDGSASWPDDFEKESIQIISQTNEPETINAPVFVYVENGCDDNWIPCKPYSVWKLSGFAPVKYGLLIAKINMKDILSANIKFKKTEYGRDLIFDFTLQNGKILKDVNEDVGNHPIVGILGLMKNGVSFIPIDKIKQIKKI